MSFGIRLPTGIALMALGLPAQAQIVAANSAETVPETVIVTGQRSEAQLPNRIENVDAADAQIGINAVNTEDMMKYMPSIVVRKRHYGDTQDPLATRTNGVGASARSLVFVDGILISSPIGNNNTYASPHFGIAQPEDVSNFQVLYGPFAAEYGGGSIGAVLNITTRMPAEFELYAGMLGAVQPFQLYGTDRNYGTWQFSGGIGDRMGNFSWRLSATHLDTVGQPLGLVTLTRPAATGSAGTVAAGAVADFNRTGAPIVDIGAGGIEAQVQDTDTVKLAYDFDNGWQATYTASMFRQRDDAEAQTWLMTAAGTAVYSGSTNLSGYSYNIAASSFSNNVYAWNQTHLAQGLTLKSGTDGELAWEMVASRYDYLDDKQRVPSAALPAALGRAAGTMNRLNGTGWYTLDAKGIWRGWRANELSFGLHRDQEMFSQIKYNLADWIHGTPTGINTDAQGRTATNAIWVQDIRTVLPDVKATLGARAEQWSAYDGLNSSASPVLNARQPSLHTSDISPKASVSWMADDDWNISASWGEAFRMPTVTELYQAVTTGTTLTVPNPKLKPERANSYELAAEYRTGDARLRLSLFREEIANALLSQSAPLVPGSTTLFNYVQNVDRDRSNGIELVAGQENSFIDGLDLQASLTYVIGRIAKDTAFPAGRGKFIPQLPKLRGEAEATYHATVALAFSLALRYSDRSFGTIDNSDPYSHTYQGFDGYMVLDTRIH
ncbi:MAG TPA: TonB-dependent receptor, partial [Rhizomicrobium sp.]|nr:TonB-dependent receptor [Rhizomicrobium sp.]